MTEALGAFEAIGSFKDQAGAEGSGLGSGFLGFSLLKLLLPLPFFLLGAGVKIRFLKQLGEFAVALPIASAICTKQQMKAELQLSCPIHFVVLHLITEFCCTWTI